MSITKEPYIKSLVERINLSWNYNRIIIFESKETDPDKAFLEGGFDMKTVHIASLIIQKTAYNGYYYVHKNRTRVNNILVDIDTLLDIIVSNA